MAWQALHGVEAELPGPLAKAGDVFNPEPLGVDGTPNGVMVCFAPSAASAETLTVVGGLPASELHCTLAYLGPVGSFDPDELEIVCAAVRAFAAGQQRSPLETPGPEWPLAGNVTGFGVFEPNDDGISAAVALVDVPSLQTFRRRLVNALMEHGITPYATHDYLPHITLAYGTIEDMRRLPQPVPVPVDFSEIIVTWPGRQERIPLDGDVLAGRWRPIVKTEARRYTLSPLYVPDSEDTHGEWATADDLEEAVARYMAAGEFDINYGHLSGTRAGRCVGVISWPITVNAVLVAGDGTVTDVEMPPGTVYQAVVWEPWAWEMVQDGRINALSMEGWAYRKQEAI
jgi:2'-5' RNA ligase